MALLTDVTSVSFVDKEPIRDIWVGIKFRMRIKRHHWDGKVSTYLTDAALDFLFQPPTPQTLDGLEEVHLIAGYHWDKELRDITAAVLPLRDGLNKQKWLIELPLPGTSAHGASPLPVSPTPPAPVIETTTKEKDQENQE